MNGFYQLNINNFGEDVINRARQFAEEVVAETYDRFGYDYDRRVDTIYIGKLAEEVFIRYAAQNLRVVLESN